MVVFLGSVDDVMIAVLTTLTKETATKGKLPLVCFVDEGDTWVFQAASRYQFHPECLNEELKRKMWGFRRACEVELVGCPHYHG